MNLRKLVLEHIRDNGLKKGFVAAKVGLSQTEFSLWLNGKTFINTEVEQNLIKFVNKAKEEDDHIQ